MKSYSISRDSWLFKIAKFGNSDLGYFDATDSCAVIRAILWGLIKGFFFASAAIFVTTLVCIIFGSAIVSFFKCGFFLNDEGMKACMGNWSGPAMLGTMFIGLGLIVAMWLGLLTLVGKHGHKVKLPSLPPVK